MGTYRNEADRVSYQRYRTILVTSQKGTIRGRDDQHLPQLIAEVYGDPAGYLPWHEDGYVGLIVMPPQQSVQCRAAEASPTGQRPIQITTHQRVLDWVISMEQEAVR